MCVLLLLSHGLPCGSFTQHVKEHRQTRFRLFDDAKVRTKKIPTQRKSELGMTLGKLGMLLGIYLLSSFRNCINFTAGTTCFMEYSSAVFSYCPHNSTFFGSW